MASSIMAIFSVERLTVRQQAALGELRKFRFAN
jgi:hypothetical protein